MIKWSLNFKVDMSKLLKALRELAANCPKETRW